MSVPLDAGSGQGTGHVDGYERRSAEPPTAASSFGQPVDGALPTGPVGYVHDPATRPGQVTAAGVLGFVIGGLGLVVHLLALGWGRSTASHNFVLTLSIAGAAVAVGYLVGGLQAVNGKDGRLLLAVAAVGIVLNVVAMVAAFRPHSLVGLVVPSIIVFLLVAPESRAWFRLMGARHF